MKPAREVRIRRLDTPHYGKKIIVAFLILLAILGASLFIINLFVNYVIPLTATSTHSLSGGLYYELAINKSYYQAGEPIELRLVVRNASPKTVVLSFPTTQRYDFVVRRDIDFVFFHFPVNVWESSYHIIPHPIPNNLTLKPGESVTFSDLWNQDDATGTQVKPGRYIISGYLKTTKATPVLQIPARMSK